MTHRTILILCLMISLIQTRECVAQSAQVPYHIQAAFFSKLFRHIPQFENETIHILIVYDTKSASDKTTLMQNFKSLGYEVDAVKPDKLVREIYGYDVVYFMSGLQKHAALCMETKKLSICGTPDYTEDGTVSIALGIENDKPRIYLNITLLQAEGKDVSAELLSISHVYQ